MQLSGCLLHFKQIAYEIIVYEYTYDLYVYTQNLLAVNVQCFERKM